MTWFGVYALAILALPVMLALRWIINDWLKSRRRARVLTQTGVPWSPADIAARVQHERGSDDARSPLGHPGTSAHEVDIRSRQGLRHG